MGWAGLGQRTSLKSVFKLIKFGGFFLDDFELICIAIPSFKSVFFLKRMKNLIGYDIVISNISPFNKSTLERAYDLIKNIFFICLQ